MTEEATKHILPNSSGNISERIIINGQDYELTCNWKRRINIKIIPSQHLFIKNNVCVLQKNTFLSIITRYPNYSIRGKRTELTEKILSNKYTPALLHFRASKLTCESHQISYTATVRKKNIKLLNKIISYFEVLLKTL